MKDRHELPLDRLATSEKSGKRIYLYPADVRGRYRFRRNILNSILLAIFLCLPWVQINGHPAVLLDIASRKFALFGVAFWAHEAPILVFIIGGAVLSLALVTAIWGRIWCGWACPQTVFVDSVFRWIERWTEGDSVQRKRLDEGPWDWNKVSKKGLKWILFSLVSLVISHSFLAYFVGPEKLRMMVQSSPSESPTAFLVMLGMFGFVLFDFGWFREQFCTLLCPYGRFQSVLMDTHTQVITYDSSRGEPRRGNEAEIAATGKTGDCINCYKCVQVCPTGIDIRRGLQMECVACTACVDVCDEVMTKIKKPIGLIRYTKPRVSLRAKIYALLLLLLVAGLSIRLYTRQSLEVTLIRAAEAPYQEIANGVVVNHYKLDLRNQSFEDLVIEFEVSDSAKKLGVNRVVSNHASVLGAGRPERADLFIQFPKTLLQQGRGKIELVTTAKDSSGRELERLSEEVLLVGPY